MSTPLHMPVATLIPYQTSPNPTTPVIISLYLYLAALLTSALILHYFHLCSNPPPYECHIFRPLPLANLPARPCPTLSPSRFAFSPHLASTLSSSLSLPPLPSSSPLKDSLHTNRMSPVSSWSNSSTMSPSSNSSTSKHALTITLFHLACPFAPPSPCCLDPSLTSLSPTPSTATWRSSPQTSSTRLSLRSSSPSPELNNATTRDMLNIIPHPLPPYPWPFASCPHPFLLPLAQ